MSAWAGLLYIDQFLQKITELKAENARLAEDNEYLRGYALYLKHFVSGNPRSFSAWLDQQASQEFDLAPPSKGRWDRYYPEAIHRATLKRKLPEVKHATRKKR